MEDEKTLDPKQGDETPADIGQSEKKTDSEQEKPEKAGASYETEVNELLEDSEETVDIPKKLLRQLKQDRDNYREGLLSSKKKLASFKKEGEKAESKRETKDVENKGIEKACEDSEIKENWRDIVKYYSPRRGKASVEDIVKDLKDAKTLWKKGPSKEKDTEDSKTTSELASLKGKPQGIGKEGKEKTKERLIIKSQKPMDKWYG